MKYNSKRLEATKGISAFLCGAIAWFQMLSFPGLKDVDYSEQNLFLSVVFLITGSAIGSFSDKKNYLAGPCLTTTGHVLAAFLWGIIIGAFHKPLVGMWLTYVVAMPVVVAFPAGLVGVGAYMFVCVLHDVMAKK